MNNAVIKNSELSIINFLLDTLKLKEFSVDDLRKYLAIKRETKEKENEIKELQIEIMKKYEIEPIKGKYTYEGHKEQKQIDESINIINKGSYTYKTETNFITFEQLKSGLREDDKFTHTADNILVLNDLLVKK